MDKVSIPFKRESVSKVSVFALVLGCGSEVSIPFKRESVSKVKSEAELRVAPYVSIPFKRESVSKAGPGMC